MSRSAEAVITAASYAIAAMWLLNTFFSGLDGMITNR